MAHVAVQLFPRDDEIVLKGVRFPVELRHDGFDPDDTATWPRIVGRLEYVDGRLLYMPPCADTQQYVAVDVVFLLRSWSESHPGFVIGGNEAGMKLGGDTRAADAAVWRLADVGSPQGRLQQVPPLLAVEVAGEDEGERELRAKARWYFDHGVVTVWIVLPDAREVLVLHADTESRHRIGETLREDARLPGLRPEVDRFFVQIAR